MQHKLKRLIDLAGAATLLILLVPILAAASLAVKLTSPGPLIFRQRRLGLCGVPFEILKFRSMICGAPEVRNPDGSTSVTETDPRLTRVGGWLRATSIDELPQLWNVFRGEMSLVGPRPDQCSQLSLYRPEEHAKLKMRPGLTGLAQISGRNRICWAERKRLDCLYVEKWSLRLDLEILLKTIPYVLGRKDVSVSRPEPDHVSG